MYLKVCTDCYGSYSIWPCSKSLALEKRNSADLSLNINNGSYSCLLSYHAALTERSQHAIILSRSTFWLHKQPLHHLSRKFVCVQKPQEKLPSELLPLCVSRSATPSLSARRQRVRQTAIERHAGKSRSWWTIRGADSSVRWAATLTWILITVVTIRKASTETTERSFPTWLLETPTARLCMVECISLNTALNDSSNSIMEQGYWIFKYAVKE